MEHRKLSGHPKLIKWICLCGLIAIMAAMLLLGGCAIGPRLNCVDRTIAGAEIHLRHYPAAAVEVVIGHHTQDEYHVEPVADGKSIRIMDDMTIDDRPETEMIDRIFTGPVKRYPYDVFKKGAYQHEVFSQSQLEIYNAVYESAK